MRQSSNNYNWISKFFWQSNCCYFVINWNSSIFRYCYWFTCTVIIFNFTCTISSLRVSITFMRLHSRKISTAYIFSDETGNSVSIISVFSSSWYNVVTLSFSFSNTIFWTICLDSICWGITYMIPSTCTMMVPVSITLVFIAVLLHFNSEVAFGLYFNLHGYLHIVNKNLTEKIH